MDDISSYSIIIAACLLVMFSYLFNLLSKRTGIPSVLLLLLAGIGTREALIYLDISFALPGRAVELFGILGLIMIILEAGLDLSVSKKKLPVVRNAFLSAVFILLISSVIVAAFLYYYLKEDFLNCLIYAIPLSVVSSAIVIPSISHLSQKNREFLIYETSFSDITGILLFNYMIAGNLLHSGNITWFFGSIALSIAVSLVLSILVLFLLTRIATKVRFFLVFAILIFLYAGGKMLHLPALFIILLFGMIVSNWQLDIFKRLERLIPYEKVNGVSHLLHALTAESSFLIRTFFFFVFGLTIDLRLLIEKDVIFAGSSIVLIMLLTRYVYLRFFLRSHVFPEVFFMPRGLITILLFYSIPKTHLLSRFNDGILFFVILMTSVIMTIGSVAYGKPEIEVISDEQPLTDN